jgi:hypothetical protein
MAPFTGTSMVRAALTDASGASAGAGFDNAAPGSELTFATGPPLWLRRAATVPVKPAPAASTIAAAAAATNIRPMPSPQLAAPDLRSGVVPATCLEKEVRKYPSMQIAHFDSSKADALVSNENALRLP